MSSSAQTVSRLRQALIDTLGPAIGSDGPFALLDFPATSNCGDHAIWLGEKALLKALGCEVAYECSMQTYDAQALAAAVGSGTILLHGGGNFGDLYIYHEFRHRVLRDFPNNKIVLLPQTVMFYDDSKLTRSAKLFAEHGNVTVAARDLQSFQVLRKFYGDSATVVMAPDAAFALGQQRTKPEPRYDIVWLSRTDKESVVPPVQSVVNLPNLRTVRMKMGEFDDGIATAIRGEIAGSRLIVTDWYRCTLAGESAIDAYKELTWDERANFWLQRALHIIKSARVVVSDRLHAHILCTLADVPHVLLDNSYGKNIGFCNTWTRPLDNCRLARSAAEAWVVAQAAVEKLKGRGDTAKFDEDDSFVDRKLRARERSAAREMHAGG